MSARLHPDTLGTLPPTVRRFGYARERHGVGIVHLGIGNFHRAHQAVYVDEAIARAGGDWRITGISCRSADVRDRMAPQDGVYSVLEADGDARHWRIVGSVARVLVASQDPASAIAAIADPNIRLVTATITEKGYCRDARGAIDTTHPDIVHDLANPGAPRSALGVLLAGLGERRNRGLAAPTVLSCDNLAHNGAAFSRVLLGLAKKSDPALADWIEAEVAFPSSMVDRIVPATTAADLDVAESALGLRDEACVRTEPFTQWVIEDFAGPRPALEQAGARLVADVRPWELAKLRMLNGTHSTLAYLGLAAGHTFVHEAMGDRLLAALATRLMTDEVAPTLPCVPGLEPLAYRDALLARFGNAALGHRLAQIAMDGSQKIPQRLLAPIAERIPRGQGIDALALAVAAWMHFVARTCASGALPDDPLANRMRTAIADAVSAEAIVDAFLALQEVFDTALAAQPRVRTSLIAQLNALQQHGTHGAIARVLGSAPRTEHFA